MRDFINECIAAHDVHSDAGNDVEPLRPKRNHLKQQPRRVPMEQFLIESITDFSRKNGFTEAQVRTWVQRGEENGLNAAGVVVRMGRRVFIRPDRFAAWVEQQTVKSRSK